MSTNYIVWKYFQDALATDDSIEAGANADVGSDYDYEAEIEIGKVIIEKSRGEEQDTIENVS